MEKRQFTAKTSQEAITKACIELGIVSSELNYRIIEKESKGFLGIGSKPAVIEVTIGEEKPVEIKQEAAFVTEPKKVPMQHSTEKKAVEKSVVSEKPKTEENPKKETVKAETKSKPDFHKKDREEKPEIKISAEDYELGKKVGIQFLTVMLEKMNIKADIKVEVDEKTRTLSFDIAGEQMGVLIGKRGQTLDSIQYLVSLVVNKESNEYLRVKLDTENYRERRKETLENLARNMAAKVKKRGRKVELDPMNPYERRIIHYALQNDRQVKTHSEGNEPYRRIVISLKK